MDSLAVAPYDMHILHTRTSQRGQAIVELIFALAMTIILVMGLVASVRVGVSNTGFAEHKLRASNYAQAGLDTARALRDRDGVGSLSSCIGCSVQIQGVDGLRYDRSMYLDSTDPSGGTRVTMEVTWNEIGKIQSTYVTTIFFDI